MEYIPTNKQEQPPVNQAEISLKELTLKYNLIEKKSVQELGLTEEELRQTTYSKGFDEIRNLPTQFFQINNAKIILVARNDQGSEFAVDTFDINGHGGNHDWSADELENYLQTQTNKKHDV